MERAGRTRPLEPNHATSCWFRCLIFHAEMAANGAAEPAAVSTVNAGNIEDAPMRQPLTPDHDWRRAERVDLPVIFTMAIGIVAAAFLANLF